MKMLSFEYMAATPPWIHMSWWMVLIQLPPLFTVGLSWLAIGMLQCVAPPSPVVCMLLSGVFMSVEMTVSLQPLLHRDFSKAWWIFACTVIVYKLMTHELLRFLAERFLIFEGSASRARRPCRLDAEESGPILPWVLGYHLTKDLIISFVILFPLSVMSLLLYYLPWLHNRLVFRAPGDYAREKECHPEARPYRGRVGTNSWSFSFTPRSQRRGLTDCSEGAPSTEIASPSCTSDTGSPTFGRNIGS